MEFVSFSTKEFEIFKKLIYEISGIHLDSGKISLVKSRLSKRLKALKLKSYQDYYDFVKSDKSGEEIRELLNAISTNVTSFFREPIHWEFLKDYFKTPAVLTGKRKLRIWSSASSTGQEPYTIMMILNEYIANISQWDIKLLATDIDTQVLAKAQKGIYTENDIGDMPKHYVQSYFKTTKNEIGKLSQVKAPLRNKILFRSFNLVRGDFSLFHNQFDMIFCRNVMIYFDRETRDDLVKNFYNLLPKGGLLFIGHSESLTSLLNYFEVVRPSIYRRK